MLFLWGAAVSEVVSLNDWAKGFVEGRVSFNAEGCARGARSEGDQWPMEKFLGITEN